LFVKTVPFELVSIDLDDLVYMTCSLCRLVLRRKKTKDFLGSRPLFFGLLSTKTNPRNMTVSAKNEVHVMGDGWFNRQADFEARH
jgi:hypothetical protein